MVNTNKALKDPTGQLFDQLEDVRAGMLGIQGSDQHMQPMSQFVDREAEMLRFITARDTDLVTAIGVGATAHFTITSTSQDFHACMSGPITQSQNREKLKELWGPMVGAWFEGGPEDPQVVLLEMPLQQAAIWASTNNSLRFGYEMIKASVSDEAKPDVGEHVIVDFRTAA
jgi:general stress protein 26